MEASLKEEGTDLVLVHMSPPDEGIRHIEEYGIKHAKLISDPELKIYKQFGLAKGGLKQVFGAESITRSMKASEEGHRLGKIAGDVFQMPGVFLIKDGSIVNAFRHRHAGELPDYKSLSSTCPINYKSKTKSSY